MSAPPAVRPPAVAPSPTQPLSSPQSSPKSSSAAGWLRRSAAPGDRPDALRPTESSSSLADHVAVRAELWRERREHGAAVAVLTASLAAMEQSLEEATQREEAAYGDMLETLRDAVAGLDDAPCTPSNPGPGADEGAMGEDEDLIAAAHTVKNEKSVN